MDVMIKSKSTSALPSRFAQEEDEELIRTLKQRRRLGNLYNVATGDRLTRRRRPIAEAARQRPKFALTHSMPGLPTAPHTTGGSYMGGGGAFERSTSPVTLDFRATTAPAESRPGTAMTSYDMDTESRAKSRLSPHKQLSKKELRDKVQTEVVSKPWYYGYNNTVGVPPSSPFANIPRYGARGLMGLTQHVGSNIPIKEELMVDEWTPPLRAGPATHNVSYSSPKAWPVNANYTKGSKIQLKEVPYWYKSQTTSTEEFRPQTAESIKLDKLVSMDKAVDLRLKEATRQERAIANIDASLRATRGKNKKPSTRTDKLGRDVRKMKQKGERREMKYFGSLTAYVNTGGASAGVDKQMKKQEAQQDIKWRLLKNLARACRAQRNSNEGLKDLGSGFSKHSKENAVPTTITRDQFVSALIRLKHYGFSESEANHLYACFDTNHTNRVNWVYVLMAIRLIHGSRHEDTVSILQGMFEVFDDNSNTPITLLNVHNVFLTCSSNETERRTILTLYRQRFKFEMDRVLKEHAANINTDGDKMVFGQLNLQYFTEGVARCPLLVEAFGEQMKARTTAKSKKKNKK